MRYLLVALVGTLALGCGDSSSEDDDEESVDTLNCAWLEGNNCWKTTLSGATSCLPAAADTGVLAADGRTCTYASGHVVTFDEPLVLPIPFDQDILFRFTLTAGGQACMRYFETETSMTLTVGNQTYEQQTTGGIDMRVTCPDGSTYSNDNALSLLECRGDLLSSLAIIPGTSWSSGDTNVSFGLIGHSDEQGLQVFSCQQ
jgi:hypothetical protein